MLGAVAAQSIAALGADADHPEFLPSLNFYLEVGQPNADTTYRSAVVDGKGAYRIRGEIGSVRILRVGLFGPAVNGSWFSLPVPTYHDFKTLHLDTQGHFDVLLSQERPANYTGDWWKLEPNTQQLLLRQVASNWATERDPRISVERIDKPVERPRPSAEKLEKRLDALADQIEHSALMLVNHVETLRKQGFINKLTVFDVSHMGGLVGQSYYEGAYDLKPEEVVDQTLRDNLPPPQDADTLAKISKVGIWPGATVLSAENEALWRSSFARAQAELRDAKRAPKLANGWSYSSAEIGNVGTNYDLRAGVALSGLLALTPEEATYGSAVLDAKGQKIDGTRRYRIHVPKEIPVDAFWSISIYEVEPDGRVFFADDPIHRYAIGDRTRGLNRNADGSTDILVQRDKPADDQLANWLPPLHQGTSIFPCVFISHVQRF